MTSAERRRPPGWDPEWDRAWESQVIAAPSGTGVDLSPVRVVRIDKGGITVSPAPGREHMVVAAKAVRRVVVGDVCGIDTDAGRIEVILDRRTVFERRAPGSGRGDMASSAKALAANMDVVLVLHALDAGVNCSRLAREMVLAWESGAQPLVVLTKADLVGPAEIERGRESARAFAPGVPVVCISASGATTSSGVAGTAELEPHLPPDTVAALLGASGAGKSTLANTLAGHHVQLTAEVRGGDQKGRHTTTAGQMIHLVGDRWLIDTPGIRAVGLWHADEGLERAFADLSPFAQQCRFADCTHTSEPGCGILDAVRAGTLAEERLEVWQALVAEVEALETEQVEIEREAIREANQRSRRRAAAQRGRPRR